MFSCVILGCDKQKRGELRLIRPELATTPALRGYASSRQTKCVERATIPQPNTSSAHKLFLDEVVGFCKQKIIIVVIFLL